MERERKKSTEKLISLPPTLHPAPPPYLLPFILSQAVYQWSRHM